jgi:hypothetical protein
MDHIMEGPSNKVNGSSSSQTSESREKFIRSIVDKLEAEPNVYEKLVVEDLSHQKNQPFKSIRVRSSRGRVIPGSEARVLALHGHGASYSHVGAVKNIVSDLNLRPGTKQRLLPYLTSPERSHFYKYLPVSAEAINLPGTIGAPDVSLLETIDNLLNWLTPYVLEMKEETPDLPIFIFGRSGSGVLAEALQSHINEHYGRVIHGSILSSPMYPGDQELLAVNRKLTDKLGRQRGEKYNPAIMDWCFRFHNDRNWNTVDFSKQKLIIFVGDDDTEVLQEEKYRFNILAQRYPENVTYILSKKRGHDQFKRVGTNNDGPRRQAYKDLYTFLYENTQLAVH